MDFPELGFKVVRLPRPKCDGYGEDSGDCNGVAGYLVADEEWRLELCRRCAEEFFWDYIPYMTEAE